jgi:hypothetical protein
MGNTRSASGAAGRPAGEWWPDVQVLRGAEHSRAALPERPAARLQVIGAWGRAR